MIDEFHKLLQYTEARSGLFRLGIYYDIWSPPHIGHFQSALNYLKENDLLYIMIDDSDYKDDHITSEQSEEIWKIYGKYNNDSRLNIVHLSGHISDDGIMSGKRAIYDLLHLINNSGIFKSTERFSEAHPKAKEIYASLNTGSDYHVNIYSSQKAINTTFRMLPGKRYTGKSIRDISIQSDEQAGQQVIGSISTYKQDNIQSSNEIRDRVLNGSLQYKDYASIRKNIPGDEGIKDSVIDVLLRTA